MRLLLVAFTASLLAVPASADNPAPPTAQQEAAIGQCKSQGLAPGTVTFNACVNKILNPGATMQSPALRAVAVCRSAGKAFPACVSMVLARLVPDKNAQVAVQAQIRDAVTVCRAQKLVGADLRACLRAQLSG